jgi:hypothetical protein
MHSATHGGLRFLLLAVLIGLTLVACNPGGAGTATEGEMTLTVTSPADGAEVSVPFVIELESSVPLGTPANADHHAHLYFDADTSSEEFDMAFGTSAEVTRDLAPGEHTIIASLRNADHSDAGPAQEITVTVVGDGAEPSSPPSEDDGGYY